ncbi:Dirigent protein [Melia azedarach]|uniref:Dirigent protein n=1 Tax=Melia azedarach TaxID=155640 RepID=A0ACC1X382_MELAZ|nr:Dirigent protein [Melia azedarach]
MAKTLIPLFFFLFFFLFAAAESYDFAKTVSPSSHGLKKKTLTHLHFYFQDIITGKAPTAVQVAQAPGTENSTTVFSRVYVMDDPLTVGPDISSKRIGSAQGIFASADQNEVGLVMVYNFAFTEGKFNGSTLSILGRNPILLPVRETSVVGGSGVFRFARGYAQARNHSFDPKTWNAVVEYNVYVLHYD